MKKIFVGLLIISVLLVIGCTGNAPSVTSSLSCETEVTDNVGALGFNQGNLLRSPESRCQEQGTSCAGGSMTVILSKDGEGKIVTLPLSCQSNAVTGWSLVGELQEMGYEYQEALFSIDCCSVSSTARSR
jgi:hypothetical protein